MNIRYNVKIYRKNFNSFKENIIVRKFDFALKVELKFQLCLLKMKGNGIRYVEMDGA